ncbi:MAG: FkbM family methyltransferase [Pseudomonadota bacterium]
MAGLALAVAARGLSALEAQNGRARAEILAFRAGRAAGEHGLIDARFHRFKNRFPYHGFVEIEAAGERFVMLSTNDDLVAMAHFWHGAEAWEPMSLGIWRGWVGEGAQVLDVGAFSGLYSLVAAAASPGVAVFAVEAARRTYGRLLSNIQANGFEGRVRAVNRAAADGPGEATFKRFRGENILGIGDSLLAKDGMDVLSEEERVETVAIDALLEAEGFVPDMVKIDVEGAEVMALSGMDTLLSEARPRLLIEVMPETAAEVMRVLGRHGYRCGAVDEAGGRLLPLGDTVARVGNLVAEPQGRGG